MRTLLLILMTILPAYGQSCANTNSCAALLSPSSDQTIVFGSTNWNMFEVPLTSFNSLARGFQTELNGLGGFPDFNVGRNSNFTTLWLFNDRDGSDPVQATAYITSFVTNNSDRANSQQGTALSVQSRATGSGNFGFLASATFNTEYDGSAILHQSIGGFFATPRNNGSGSMANTVGIHVANQHTAGGTTGRGIEFEDIGLGSRDYNIHSAGGNNWLGKDTTWMHKLMLGCPATEQVCNTDTVANLPTASGTNAGMMMKVTDSTAISSEGQTCAGSGSAVALAFSNGSVWKCF